MARSVLEVEEVSGRVAFRRFLELPHALHRGEPRWSAPLAAWDRGRLDPMRNPFYEAGDGAYFLVRRLGSPVGRITAHVAADGDEAGCFGFFDVADDAHASAALVEAAAGWLRERGCRTMTGPLSLTAHDESGLLVDGFEIAGTTGRWWHPPWCAEGLRRAGLAEVPGSRRPTWRLAAEAFEPLPLRAAGPPPSLVGPYADQRIAGVDAAAAPDLTAMGSSPWQLAKRAKRGDWEGCTIVRCDGDPALLVPRVAAAAAAAGYAWVVAPWSPDPAAAPETEHALFTMVL